MKVAFFSSEVFPYSKTGGLADVSAALPKALQARGIDIKIFTPLYKGIRAKRVNSQYSTLKINGKIEVIFIDRPEYFQRDNLYTDNKKDYPDNIERFSFFCKKSLEILKDIDFSPCILHCNDWQTAFVSVYRKTLYKKDEFFKRSKVVLTVHNLAFQGYFDEDEFICLGLLKKYKPLFSIYSRLNALKAGIITADRVTTVSPSYAEEVQTDDLGCGLGNLLNKYRFKLSGIINAIDHSVWNPQKDKYIYQNYDKDSLAKKNENKLALQKEVRLKEDKKKMLFGMVSRLTEQKGLDILSRVLPELLEKFEFIILGLGQEKYHAFLEGLQDKFPEKIRVFLEFNEALAHKIYAGSDVILMPSRFEPCGLSQLIGFKYGTIPLIHVTGGLKDTVGDCFDSKLESTGFRFYDYDPESLKESVFKAAKVFKESSFWNQIQARVMEKDFSWDKSAKKYINLYNDLKQGS